MFKVLLSFLVVVAAAAGLKAGPVRGLTGVDSVHFLDASTGWATTGNQSKLLMTVDGGGRWTNISPPALRARGRILAGGLAGAFMLSRADLWVSIFNDSVDKLAAVEVLNSTDGGRHWSDRGSFPRDYGSAWLYFTSARRGWLLVDDGAAAGSDWVTVYGTDTGGAHWRLLAGSRDPTIWSGTPGGPAAACDKTGISFSSSTSGWIGAGCNGPLELPHTSDGGREWQEDELERGDYGDDLDPPQFFNASDGVMIGGLGSPTGTTDAVFNTTNGGSSWSAHVAPVRTDGPIDALSATTWLIADGHTLYLTRDGGSIWTPISSPIAPGGYGSDRLDFVSTRVGWAITAGGALWCTTDGGRSWRPS
jgi:photosystem II stability/assembly factor-like uncharacterized protein